MQQELIWPLVHWVDSIPLWSERSALPLGLRILLAPIGASLLQELPDQQVTRLFHELAEMLLWHQGFREEGLSQSHVKDTRLIVSSLEVKCY